MDTCPIENAIYRRKDGLIIIDPTKCTGCAHLLDNGWKVPRSVDACPTECLKFGEESELKDLIKKGESPHPEFKTKPRLYYLNIPKKFVAVARSMTRQRKRLLSELPAHSPMSRVEINSLPQLMVLATSGSES